MVEPTCVGSAVEMGDVFTWDGPVEVSRWESSPKVPGVTSPEMPAVNATAVLVIARRRRCRNRRAMR